MKTINKVRRVRPEDKSPVVIGSVFVTDGAWDRKYGVTAVTPAPLPTEPVEYFNSPWRGKVTFHAVSAVEVTIQFLGFFYKTGRTKLAKNKTSKTLMVYTDKDGQELVMAYYSGGLSRCPQVHVIPQ
jgi:hypothetical protein